jgi:hypothetical protein
MAQPIQSALFLYATKLYPDTIKLLEHKFQCKNCRQFFSLYDNIGTWNCKYHVGKVSNNAWECCGESVIGSGYRQTGCVSCDHFIDWKEAYITADQLGVYLPVTIVNIMRNEWHVQFSSGAIDPVEVEYRINSDDKPVLYQRIWRVERKSTK